MIQNRHIQFKQLRNQIRGDVSSDRVTRRLFASDASIFEIEPACVVSPYDSDDVIRIVKFAAENGLAVHSRGAGSGVCGSAVGNGVVIDFTRYMNRLIRIDEAERIVWCEPGYRLGELNAELEGSGLFFPPDPSSGEYATFGGVFGTNASGSHSVKYGNTADYTLDADIVFADGTPMRLSEIADTPFESLPAPLQNLYRLYTNNRDRIEGAYPDVPFNNAGYNLRGLVDNGRLETVRLLAGSEGTLAVVVRIKLKLLTKPKHDSLVVAFMKNTVSAARATAEILPMNPSGIEIMDKSLLSIAVEYDSAFGEHVPEGVDNILLVEFDGVDAGECRENAEKAKQLLIRRGYANSAYDAVLPEEKERFRTIRKAAVPILFRLKGEKKMLALIEDAVVPIDRMVDYFQGIYRIFDEYNLRFAVYGHIAKGLLHIRPLLNLKSAHDVSLLKALADDFFSLVDSLGGSVSGEHGDGRLRSAYLERRYPEIYELFLETKRILDPEHRLNPDIITASPSDQMVRNLRFGTDYRTDVSGKTELKWAEGIIPEIEKCHGCSKCTTVTAATRMCPVFKATRDEKASPRAKANLLRWLIGNRYDHYGNHQRAILKVMQLCLGCGNCSIECPSGVDIPNLVIEAKANFIGRRRPAPFDIAVAGFETAARRLYPVSSGLNRAMASNALRKIGERTIGISANIRTPEIDNVPLARRLPEKSGPNGPSAIFFAGCFAGYNRPGIGEASAAVLKRLGMTVYFPDQNCCGLPPASRGMAKAARAKIRANFRKWAGLLKTADYIVTSCSSCAYMLVRKWPLFDAGAKTRLAAQKTVHISELVMNRLDRFEFKPMDSAIAYHLPCHMKMMDFRDRSAEMLSRIPGVRLFRYADRCCGLAGAWGMAADNDPVSRKIGTGLIESVSAPEIRMTATDCPACAVQLEQLTGKPSVHPVEVLV